MSYNRRLAVQDQPASTFVFSADNLAFAKDTIAKYPEGREASAIIPLLWRAHEQNGNWLSRAAIEYVAAMLNMPYIRALEVATFYTMFQLQPVGTKAHVQVCGTTPCMLRGAGELIDICKNRIHHDAFHLSADGAFSWEEVECAGACVNAPMVQIGKDTYEDLTPETFGKLLDGFASGKPPKAGPQNGRQFAEPEGGATSLNDNSPHPNPLPKGEGKQTPLPAGEVGSQSRVRGSTNELTDAKAKKPTVQASEREAPAPAAVVKAAESKGEQKGDA